MVHVVAALTDRYGLQYDLDRFNIVATDFFNMGAMENKSLNVFNTSYVVGGQHRSTDADLENIARVVAHEYVLAASTTECGCGVGGWVGAGWVGVGWSVVHR